MLAPPADDGGGSPWWRAINDELLRDKVEADRLAAGSGDEPSSRTVGLWLEFIAAPSAATWYRAHNASVVAGYLKHEPLAANELWVERFMMNVALVRVLYAHALAAAPQLALGLFAPLGRWLGDPRRRAVRLFLDLRNVFPDAYPLDGWELEELLAAEQQLGRALDYGLIASRLTELYEFAAAHIGEPRITTLESDGAPCYSWPREHRELFLGGTSSRLAARSRSRPDAGNPSADPSALPAALLLHLAFGPRHRLEPLVGDRLAARDREAVGALLQAALGALDRRQDLVQLLSKRLVALGLLELLPAVAEVLRIVGSRLVAQRRQGLLDPASLLAQSLPGARIHARAPA